MTPKVSVIIPNYNHARYLPQRLESVLQQTFRDVEVILMDDCSTDNSRAVIAEYAARDACIRVVLNEQNSGSTFKQWNKGLALAQGQYVWLAESDDYAALDLLETLVAKLDAHPAVGLAYCDSFTVDADGKTLSEMKNTVNESLKTDLWSQDFLMPGQSFLKEYMSFINGIPNASAVLLRKSVLDAIGPADTSMRLAGDWVHWNKILYTSDVAYIRKPLNFFRTHTSNVRSNTLKNGVFLEEISRVMVSIKRMFSDEPYNNSAIKLFMEYWLYNYKAGNIPFVKNFLIAKNISQIVGGAHVLLGKLAKFVVGNVLEVGRRVAHARG